MHTQNKGVAPATLRNTSLRRCLYHYSGPQTNMDTKAL